MAHDLKALTLRWFEAIWNEGDLSVIQELLSEKPTLRDSALAPGDLTDPAALARQVQELRRAVPDLHIEVEELVEEGNKVLARCKVTGSHTGQGLGFEPSGASFTITGMALGEYSEGKVVRGWNNFDLLSMYEQLGALKRPSREPAA